MKTVEVSQSALESLQKMVEKLQGERDALYNAISNVATAENLEEKTVAMDDAVLMILSMDAPR